MGGIKVKKKFSSKYKKITKAKKEKYNGQNRGKESQLGGKVNEIR